MPYVKLVHYPIEVVLHQGFDCRTVIGGMLAVDKWCSLWMEENSTKANTLYATLLPDMESGIS